MAFSTFSSINSHITKRKAISAPAYSLTDIVDTTSLAYFYKFETGDVNVNNKLLNYATGNYDLTLVGNPIQNNVCKYGSHSMRGSPSSDTPLSNYAYITNCATFRNTGFTISFWFYTATVNAETVQTYFISRRCDTNPMTSNTQATTQEFEIRGSWQGVGNSFYLHVYGNKVIKENIILPPGINGTTLNNWYHVAVSVNSSASKVKIYINGENTHDLNIATTIFGTTNVSIFSLMADYSAIIGRSNYTNMDNIRIYNRVLTGGTVGVSNSSTGTEIKALYDET